MASSTSIWCVAEIQTSHINSIITAHSKSVALCHHRLKTVPSSQYISMCWVATKSWSKIDQMSPSIVNSKPVWSLFVSVQFNWIRCVAWDKSCCAVVGLRHVHVGLQSKLSRNSNVNRHLPTLHSSMDVGTVGMWIPTVNLLVQIIWTTVGCHIQQPWVLPVNSNIKC